MSKHLILIFYQFSSVTNFIELIKIRYHSKYFFIFVKIGIRTIRIHLTKGEKSMTKPTKDKIERAANVAGVVLSGVLWAIQVAGMIGSGGKVK